MSGASNAERAASADAALIAYLSRSRCDCEDGLTYLLGDLMHWAEKARIAFGPALYLAQCRYAAESEEERIELLPARAQSFHHDYMVDELRARIRREATEA